MCKRRPCADYDNLGRCFFSLQVHREINKQVKATVWMANDYPLKLKHIMPALEILSVRVRSEEEGRRGVQNCVVDGRG